MSGVTDGTTAGSFAVTIPGTPVGDIRTRERVLCATAVGNAAKWLVSQPAAAVAAPG